MYIFVLIGKKCKCVYLLIQPLRPIDMAVFGLPKRVAHFPRICLLSFDIDAIESIGLSLFKHTLFSMKPYNESVRLSIIKKKNRKKIITQFMQ